MVLIEKTIVQRDRRIFKLADELKHQNKKNSFA